MSGEQVRLSGPAEILQSSQLDHADHQAVNSKLWARREKKSESRRCCAEHVEPTILMTSGRSQMVTTGNCGNWHTVVGEIRWSPMSETTMDCDSKLVLHPLRNTQPVQIIMHQPRQTTLVFPGLCDQTRCSILNPLQPFRDLLWCGSQSWVVVVDPRPRCDKGMD